MDLVCWRCQQKVFKPSTFKLFWLDCKKSGYEYPVSEAILFKTSLAELQQSAQSSCNFCALVLDSINESIKLGEIYKDDTKCLYRGSFKWTVWFSFGRDNQRKFNGLFYMGHDQRSYIDRYEIHTLVDDPAAEFCSRRDIKPDLTSSKTWTKVRHWLVECVDHHRDCPDPDQFPMPTRVLKILKSESGQPRKTRLVKTGGRKGRYVALSYTWGGKSNFQTTRATIKSMEEGFPVESLPKTLYDATKVASMLGLEYLWVDSLCIIQDSEEDKAQEIGKMGDVYSQAFLTVSASNSDAADRGFLDYKFKEQSLAVLPFICPSGAVGKIRLRRADWYSPALEPLNTRGWALQERILSPRLLDYTSLHVSWRCRSAQHKRRDRQGKDFYEPETRQEALVKLHSSQPSPGLSPCDILISWDFIIKHYTNRSLTFQTDKLPAVGGIASYFHRLLKDEYVAGLWRSDLSNSLLWSGVSRLRSELDIAALYRPANDPTPSWSWASVCGRVDNNHFLRQRPPEPTNQFRILDCRVHLTRPDQPFGQVSSGTLTLKCLTGRATPISNVDGWGAGLRMNGAEAAVYPDDFNVWDRQPQTRDSLVCIEVYRDEADDVNGWRSQGLCLELVGDGLYRRIACYKEHDREKRGSMFDGCVVHKITLV